MSEVKVDKVEIESLKVWHVVVGRYGFYAKLKKVAAFKLKLNFKYIDREEQYNVTIWSPHHNGEFVVPVRTYDKTPIVLNNVEELLEFQECSDLPMWITWTNPLTTASFPIMRIESSWAQETYEVAKKWFDKRCNFDYAPFKLIDAFGQEWHNSVVFGRKAEYNIGTVTISFRVPYGAIKGEHIIHANDVPMWLRGLWLYYHGREFKTSGGGRVMLGDVPEKCELDYVPGTWEYTIKLYQ